MILSERVANIDLTQILVFHIDSSAYLAISGVELNSLV